MQALPINTNSPDSLIESSDRDLTAARKAYEGILSLCKDDEEDARHTIQRWMQEQQSSHDALLDRLQLVISLGPSFVVQRYPLVLHTVFMWCPCRRKMVHRKARGNPPAHSLRKAARQPLPLNLQVTSLASSCDCSRGAALYCLVGT